MLQFKAMDSSGLSKIGHPTRIRPIRIKMVS